MKKIKTLYNKYYNNISRDIFETIISSDKITTNKENDKLGKYAKWLLKLYLNDNLLIEDLYKAEEYLPIFDRVVKSNKIKNEEKDLYNINSLNEMFLIIKPFLDGDKFVSKNEEILTLKKDGAENVYEDDEFLVVKLLTKEGSQYYGANTQWCTASKSGNIFDEYNEKGSLYVIIDKINNKKYQFHFETKQYMDENDGEINFSENEKLFKLFIKIMPHDETVIKLKRFQCGIINRNGDWVIRPIYSDILELEADGNRRIRINGRDGLLDKNGKYVLEPIYEKIGVLEGDGCRVLKQNGKAGIINKNGDWVVKPIYDNLSELEADGNRVVAKGLYMGLMDKNNNIILDYKQCTIFKFEDGGRIFLKEGMNSFGIMDGNGKYMLDPIYKNIKRCKRSKKYVVLSHNDEWGLMNTNFEWEIPLIKDGRIELLEEDNRRRIIIGNKCGLMDENNNWVLEPKYRDMWELEGDGNRRVRSGLEDWDFYDWGLIDRDGNYIIEPKHGGICELESDGNRRITSSDNKWGLVDSNGHMLVEQKYKFISSNKKNGFRGCQIDNDKWGLIDKDGNEVLKPIYDNIGAIFKEKNKYVVLVRVGNDWGLSDLDGNLILDIKYSMIGNIREDGRRLISLNYRFGLKVQS